ncbi:MAG: hypothetical protein IKY83_05475 [Proteobacteria bacterium]|nr:hypothetical protein [Pseudomonadota bacterium]
MKILPHLLIACTLLVSACEKPQADQIYESLTAIENAMRTHINEPEKLLTALDDCIDQYQDVWANSKVQEQTADRERLTQEYDIRADKLRQVMIHLVNLDLEIQDRLLDDPEMLRAYEARIARIGTFRQPPAL